ncbi:MAG: UbiD family decarboxylase [Thermoplasmatota archaeon]
MYKNKSEHHNGGFFLSFQKYVESFEKRTVKEKVSPELDLTREAKKDLSQPVYFPNFPGGESIVNLWATRERVGKALGVKKEEIVDLLADAVGDLSEPREVEEAPIKENHIDNFDLRDYPIPKYYPKDGGRYITSGVVLAEYEGVRNLSFHRMMLIDEDKFTIRLVPRNLHRMYKEAMDNDDELRIAVAIGLEPAVLLAGATSVDFDVDELKIANSLKRKGTGKDIEVTRIEDGLIVPAEAEYVLEGKIIDELDDEGPFVDITSTYDHVRQQPVVEIERIWHRDDPIFHALLPGGYEHFLLMGLPRESVMKRKVDEVTKVKDARLTEGGCSWLHGVVSIDKQNDDEPERAIKAAFEGHTSMKKVTIVDEDVDIFNDDEVEWAVATRFQPDEDIYVYEDQKGSSLDPSAPDLTAKWGIDATKPWEGEEFDRAELQ